MRVVKPSRCCASIVERMTAERGNTLVIGLGNPILGDDGIGWHVAEAVEAASLEPAGKSSTSFEYCSAGGLGLMELMVGYEKVIIADAIAREGGKIGTVLSMPFTALTPAHANSSHDATLYSALETGRKMGWPLPSEIWVVGVEIEPSYTFSETLSPAVAAAIPQAAELVLARLESALAKNPRA